MKEQSTSANFELLQQYEKEGGKRRTEIVIVDVDDVQKGEERRGGGAFETFNCPESWNFSEK